MQAFKLSTSWKIANRNSIATRLRCQPFLTGESHQESLNRTGFAIAVTVCSFDPALEFLMRDKSMLLFTPEIPFSIR